MPLEDIATTPGAGTLDVSLVVTSIATGQAIAVTGARLTGRASNAYLIDFAGAVHPLQNPAWGGPGILSFDQITGLPAGLARLVFPGYDPCLVGVNDEKMGTFNAQYTIT